MKIRIILSSESNSPDNQLKKTNKIQVTTLLSIKHSLKSKSKSNNYIDLELSTGNEEEDLIIVETASSSQIEEEETSHEMKEETMIGKTIDLEMTKEIKDEMTEGIKDNMKEEEGVMIEKYKIETDEPTMTAEVNLKRNAEEEIEITKKVEITIKIETMIVKDKKDTIEKVNIKN